MAKRPALFKQSDLRRALRATKCAGLEVKSVEVDPATGKITITTTAGIELPAPNNALDQWLASHARPT